MRKGTIGILTFAVALLLAGAAVAGGAVWVSDDGAEHKIGSHAIFIDDGGDSYDLAELEDGETRVFGSGDKQITASRDGDIIAIASPEGGDGRAIRVECEVGRDSCKVTTFGENDEKVALMIKKSHSGQHLMTIDEEILHGEHGEATIMITQVGGCEDDGEADCIGGEMVIEMIASVAGGDLSKNVWVSGDGPHHGSHTMMVTDGATSYDLSELYDGETRIFGFGERQVSAVRDGDNVSISRPQSDEDEDLMTCKIGRDTCHVLTYDDDPEKVSVMIARTVGDAQTIHRIKIVHTEDD